MLMLILSRWADEHISRWTDANADADADAYADEHMSRWAEADADTTADVDDAVTPGFTRVATYHRPWTVIFQIVWDNLEIVQRVNGAIRNENDAAEAKLSKFRFPNPPPHDFSAAVQCLCLAGAPQLGAPTQIPRVSTEMSAICDVASWSVGKIPRVSTENLNECKFIRGNWAALIGSTALSLKMDL